MGKINDVVPIFGQRFNDIYPLVMVIYTLLVASNFFDRIYTYFGSWKRVRFQTEDDDDMDGFDPSGLMILSKERTWLEEGQRVGEHVLPLARNFNDVDVETRSNFSDEACAEMKMSSSYDADTSWGTSSKSEIARRYGASRETITNKYAAMREHKKKQEPTENMASAKVSLLESEYVGGESSSGLVSTWRNMKLGLQSFKDNATTKSYLPLRQISEASSSTRMQSSLEEIFQRLKNRSLEHR